MLNAAAISPSKVKQLIASHADVNVQDNYGNTPLYNAIYGNSSPSVKALVEHGAHVNVKNNDGKTPLDEARGRPEIEAYLEAHGARGEVGGGGVDADSAGGVQAAAPGGGKGSVEALPADRVRAFLPESLGGLARTEISAQRNGAVGIQVSEAEARYSDNAEQSIRLKVADLGGAAGFAALASWANVEVERQTRTGYEKTYKSGGRMIHEQWDNSSKSGQYTVMVGERFSVEASGNAPTIDVLKLAVNSIDLGGLEALRNEGVKAH